MNIKKKQLLLVTFLIPLISFSQQQDVADLSLEEILNLEVVTATKTSARADLVPSVIEVITKEQIKQKGYQTLAQVLNDLSDNHEDRNNWGIGEPLSQNAGFGFRFDTGQNILFLFNGQRLNAFLPGNRFGGEEYLLDNTEKIEIIRGPGSALYGSNAFTAVVNIITQTHETGDPVSFKVGAEYLPLSSGKALKGSFLAPVLSEGNLSGSFRYSSENGQSLSIENDLFGNDKIKDGIDHTIDGELFYQQGRLRVYSKLSNQKRNTATGFNGVSPSNMDELKLSMYAYSLGSDYTYPINEKSDVKFSLGWHQDNWTEVALIPLFKTNAQMDSLIRDNNGNPILDTVSVVRNGKNIQTSFVIDGQGADTRSIDGEVQLTYNYINKNNWVVGLYASEDKILSAYRPTELSLDPLQFIPFQTLKDASNNWLFDLNASRRNIGLYSQMDYDIMDGLVMYIGARMDFYSGTGKLESQNYNEFNPRGGLVYEHENAGIFKILYGRATRVPNGFETLSSVAILGDPKNTAERISNFQVQWLNNWLFNLRTELGYFNTTIENRLETNADLSEDLLAKGYIGQFVNVDGGVKQSNNGIDGKIVYKINSISTSVNFTQYFASDNGKGHPLDYVPMTMINGDINMPYGWSNFNFGFNFRGNFNKPETDLRDAIKNYVIGRLTVVLNPPEIPFEFRITGRNIFNTQYYFPSSSYSFVNNFPARGFELELGASYKFN